MKFLITWKMHEGKLHETLALFSQMTQEEEESLMGGNMKLLGRWHDLVRVTGAAVFEVDSAEDLTSYTLNWNQFMDLDISVVVDDDTARAIGSQIEIEG